VNLNAAQADFAVGCGYKFLNGGPGAPAFVWAHARHAGRARQPLSGWLGHAAPFRFEPGYQAAAGMARYLCGTPPILSLAALECGVATVVAAEASGGIAALRVKSLALSELFIALADAHLRPLGLSLVTPRSGAERGSQVSFACPGLPEGAGWTVMQALIEQGVIGDFRAGQKESGEPDLLRFGLTPLYTRFVDVHDAVSTLANVLARDIWREQRFQRRSTVT
jgi:kynureninase